MGITAGGIGRWTGPAGLLGLAALAGVAGAAAQEAPDESDRRCVCVGVGPSGSWMGEMGPLLDLQRQRARLGISLDPGQESRYDSLGARVRSVVTDGPADEAGLREGDVVVALDGRSLLEPLEGEREARRRAAGSPPVRRLLRLARDFEPGDTVEIRYLRDGREATARVVTEEVRAPFLYAGRLPGMGPGRVFFEQPGEGLRGDIRAMVAPGARGWSFSLGNACPGGSGLGWGADCAAGLRLTPVNPDLGQYFQTSEGLLVTEVSEGSELGLRPGDVIQSVGDRAVETPADVRRILSSYRDDEAVRFRIVRQGRELTVEGRLR